MIEAIDVVDGKLHINGVEFEGATEGQLYDLMAVVSREMLRLRGLHESLFELWEQTRGGK